jgi:DNA-binding MarR family transcriptional regulator
MGGASTSTAPDTSRPLVAEDQLASEVLLAFARLARGRAGHTELPTHVDELLRTGFLAPRHLGVLAVISLAGPLTVSALAEREGFAVSTTSLLVTQLAEAGLVERTEDVQDRRRTVVSIAPEFRRDGEDVLESRLAPIRRTIRRLGPARAKALLEGLQLLAEEAAASRDLASVSTMKADRS